MESKSKFQQIAVLSAGTFTNLVLAILFFLLLALFFIVTFIPSGAMFNVYVSQPIEINSITNIGGIPITNPTTGNIIDIINENNLSDNLILGTNGNTLKLTKITANNKSYYMTIDILKNQLIQETDYVFLYLDTSAIKTGLKGTIIKIDNNKINTHNDLSIVLEKYKPGDTIQITTRIEKETFNYEIELIEHPASEKENQPMIGIGYSAQQGGVTSTITEFFNFFRKPATEYQPRFNVDLIEFIYDLIWWLALINLSVALVNMWPVAIFDGGRMFMLTIWAITGSEKFGELAFKIMTWIIAIF